MLYEYMDLLACNDVFHWLGIFGLVCPTWTELHLSLGGPAIAALTLRVRV